MDVDGVRHDRGNHVNGVTFTGSGGGHLIRNNIFYHSEGDGAIQSGYESLYTASGNIEKDPLFVNANRFDFSGKFVGRDNYDFRVKPGSPAIAAGISQYAPSVDIEGNPRPTNGLDIGVYQYRDGGGSPPTTPDSPKNLRLK